ncbi:TetR/AcrR family transcriptional regulator [Nocardioides gansuensis]|nr:TetR/AcrR family transcriptional regulator [Nocardioides gansuensis]
MARADTRKQTLDAAERLFFSDGIAVTSVDAVAREAGVSVVTLYKHFGSKDGLIGAVLSRRLEAWDGAWQTQIDATEDQRGKVLAIFDAVTAFRAKAGPAQWCCFLATASERPIADDVPAQLVSRDNALLQERLRRYAEAADPERSDEIVATVTLVYNGVLSSLLRGTPEDPASLGRRTVATALGWQDLTTSGS